MKYGKVISIARGTAGANAKRVSRWWHGPHAVPELLWAPLASAALLVIAGFLGLLLGQPLLLPSIAPTAMLQAMLPQLPTARLPNVLIGHGVGIIVAILAVVVLGADHAPSIFEAGRAFPPRIWASALAIAMLALIQSALKSPHPPAAATALLFTLGGLKASWTDVRATIIGVLVIAFFGEALRRLRLMQPAP